MNRKDWLQIFRRSKGVVHSGRKILEGEGDRWPITQKVWKGVVRCLLKEGVAKKRKNP